MTESLLVGRDWLLTTESLSEEREWLLMTEPLSEERGWLLMTGSLSLRRDWLLVTEYWMASFQGNQHIIRWTRTRFDSAHAIQKSMGTPSKPLQIQARLWIHHLRQQEQPPPQQTRS